MCASDLPGVSRAWTASGKVFVQGMCSKIRRMKKLPDLQQLPCDASSLATSTPATVAAAQQRHNRGPMKRRGSHHNKWRSIFNDPPSQEKEVQQIPGDKTAANTSHKE